ncbi:MAG: nitroreductase family protein [Clostridia bacterium]|nr:nitroreductase family protein [Clostridia bacterium]
MLKELLTGNRTCRTFDESRRITREELLDMVDCARLTPSSMNLQPLCFRIVYTPEELQKVQPLTKWAGALPELHLPPEGHRPTAFIVICQDTEKFGDGAKFQKDVGITALAIHLRAAEMGLAGCMIGSFAKGSLKEALALPGAVEPLLVIGLGKADETREIVGLRDGSTTYYREDGVHKVPKRALEDIVLG